ncbi:MAG: ABC transporter permease [Phycisphaerales bacterium]
MRWLKQLAVVQEFGLIAVIAVLMAGLWLFTPSIPRSEFRALIAADKVATTADGFDVAFASGKTEHFSSAKGWTLGQRGNTHRLERKERIPLPAAAKVEEVAEMRARVGGPFSYENQLGYRVTGSGSADGDYPTGEGHHWTLNSTDDGRRTLERDPHVNKFLNADNLFIVATSASFYGIMAVGLTAIIVLGGIDLSVGAIYALASVVGASLLHRMQEGAGSEGSVNLFVALAAGVGVCCLIGATCGFINGAASVGLGVHPFIITLGGMGVYRGTAFVITKGLSIGDLPPAYGNLIRTKVGGIEPVPLLVMIATGLAGAFVFTRTVFGRRIFAIGGNETAARYAGIPVRASKIWVFVLAGLLAGLSAAIAIGKYGSASSADGTGYELDVIAAAVVGGASLTGGRGTAIGAILGAIVIQLINNGFEVLQIDANYKQIVIGLAIVIAVVVDQMKTRFAGLGPRR